MYDSTRVTSLLTKALEQADPERGNDLHRGLLTFWEACWQVEPGTEASLSLMGVRGQILVWHNHLSAAEQTFARIIELATRQGYVRLRRQGYEWLDVLTESRARTTASS